MDLELRVAFELLLDTASTAKRGFGVMDVIPDFFTLVKNLIAGRVSTIGFSPLPIRVGLEFGFETNGRTEYPIRIVLSVSINVSFEYAFEAMRAFA